MRASLSVHQSVILQLQIDAGRPAAVKRNQLGLKAGMAIKPSCWTCRSPPITLSAVDGLNVLPVDRAAYHPEAVAVVRADRVVTFDLCPSRDSSSMISASFGRLMAA